ncbi:DegT/DnrJ/EryC1/StrS family aminotransferase [bacterium AH-315-K03]|nr:DegT/DnrJ/EryC1/StrS family aminotransferase [bacterium AH-315-K03]
MRLQFPIIIVDDDFRLENSRGISIRALAQTIENHGAQIVSVTGRGDLNGFVQQQNRASAFVLSVDDEEFSDEQRDATVQRLTHVVERIRSRNARIPIFLNGETRTSRDIPNVILKELHGFVHMFEDTLEFIAGHIVREAKSYLDRLPPPFFRALTQYAADRAYSWHCPGHSGGVAFLKNPLGNMFHEFFGENMLRTDVCNAVEVLGQLLDHTGPVVESEKNAAKICHADHLFFVTNGTSTSNKIVWHSLVAPGDVVVVDRNCHKSVLHAIIMTGAIPVFITPTRNYYGIIGPIPKREFEWSAIQEKIRRHPLVKDSNSVPRLLTITQCTYDGILYNVEEIKQLLDGRLNMLIQSQGFFFWRCG